MVGLSDAMEQIAAMPNAVIRFYREGTTEKVRIAIEDQHSECLVVVTREMPSTDREDFIVHVIDTALTEYTAQRRRREMRVI